MFELLTSSSMLRFTGYGQKYHVLGCICYKMIISYPRLTRLNHALVQMNFWHDDDVITTFMVHWLWFKNMFWVVNTINPIISHPICIRLDRINHTLVHMNSWHDNDNVTTTLKGSLVFLYISQFWWQIKLDLNQTCFQKCVSVFSHSPVLFFTVQWISSF